MVNWLGVLAVVVLGMYFVTIGLAVVLMARGVSKPNAWLGNIMIAISVGLFYLAWTLS